MQSHKAELIAEAERNDRIVRTNNHLQLFHTIGFGTTTFRDELKKAAYTKSKLELQFCHNRFNLGSVTIDFGVVGYLMSEHAYLAPGKEDFGPSLDLCFQAGLDTSAVKKVDPDFLGARIKIIIQGLRKEISN